MPHMTEKSCRRTAEVGPTCGPDWDRVPTGINSAICVPARRSPQSLDFNGLAYLPRNTTRMTLTPTGTSTRAIHMMATNASTAAAAAISYPAAYHTTPNAAVTAHRRHNTTAAYGAFIRAFVFRTACISVASPSTAHITCVSARVYPATAAAAAIATSA